MAPWEYHKTSNGQDLDDLGREGWELVAVLPSAPGGNATFYFKRPAVTFREQVTLDQKRRYYGLMELPLLDDGAKQSPSSIVHRPSSSERSEL